LVVRVRVRVRVRVTMERGYASASATSRGPARSMSALKLMVRFKFKFQFKFIVLVSAFMLTISTIAKNITSNPLSALTKGISFKRPTALSLTESGLVVSTTPKPTLNEIKAYQN